MGGSKTIVANIGVATACLVSLMWVVVVASSMHWVTSNSLVVNFEANLVSVYTKKGMIPGVMSLAGHLTGKNKWAEALDAVMDRDLWMEDANAEFCGVGLEQLFRWCNTWTLVLYGSWLMLFSIILTVGLLLSGAFFMYYYSSVHATETGRVCCKVCYATAPLSVSLGLMIYTGCTLEFGQDALLKNQFQAHAMYSAGYVLAWGLTIFTWVPLYTMAVFMRRDPLEKKHWECEEDARLAADQQQAYAATYGASANPYGVPAPGEGLMPANAQHAQAYSAATAYGGQTAQYGTSAPSAPPQSGGQWGGPGYGAAAW